MLKDINQIVGTAMQKVIDAGIGRKNKELRDAVFAEAGIDVEKDCFEDVFRKLMDWLDSDSELVKELTARSVEEWSKNLVDVKDVTSWITGGVG